MATQKMGALSQMGAMEGMTGGDSLETALGGLMPSEEELRGDRNLAWGAGFGSPGDVGGALSRAMKGELEQRNKQTELRNLYLPAVIDAISQKQNMAQLAQIMQSAGAGALAGGPGGAAAGAAGGGLANMSADQIAMLKRAGIDLTSLWETAKFGKQQAPGSFAVMPDGTTRHFPDASGVTYDLQGRMVMAPNSAEIKANQSAAQAYGQGLGQEPFETVQTIGPGGQPGIIRKSQLPGRAGPPVPYPAVPGAPGANPGQLMGGGPNPTPGPNPTRSAAPASAGRPVVSPQEQAARDGDALQVLQSEARKIAQQLQDPRLPAEQRQRLEQDLAGVTREIERIPRDRGAAPSSFTPTDLSPGQKTVNANLQLSSKNWLDNVYPSIMTSSDNAKEAEKHLATVRNMLDNLGPNGTGWGTEQVKKPLAEALGAMGVKNANAAATNYQNFQQAVSTNMWEFLNAAKGPQTEGDATRAKETLARLSKTEDANRFIIDLTQASIDQAKRKADFYRKARTAMQNAGEPDLAQIDEAWGSVSKSVWDNPVMDKWKAKK